MVRKRLGKGLQALIPEIEDAPIAEALELPITQIQLNPYQPRKTFNEEKLAELARSVEQHGILQPLIVRPAGQNFELVAGERRLRAAGIAGLEQVPVVVKLLSDREMMEIALIENLQREDLNPLEEAEAYRRLLDEYGYTQEQLAERVGKSRPAVANTLRLLALHPDVRREVADGRLSEGHARAILALSLEKQSDAARKAMELGLSVRETERLASHLPKVRSEREKKPDKDGYLADLEDRLRQACGTAVHVRMMGKSGGKLEIQFHDLDELERLCELLF
ncbi:MAG: ParB/RepB/Spo0J family partition protein [Dethiobacter sp.]|jgi:ParB family chromosome partitioning protein|nr:ParB/RepB/Spo0J family partition protein [Dethiobacter sp.]MBS3897341.1 ParB/RepB/Spo0J family partition protein [Dethiobacter sp.]MBS3983844.1 ParB/RepB/Spo0J family partition protein [Dethiobacter sp.]MCL4463604.1 ParB/RepB/Spo0J family partition protein [Bacillota bacterium]MCL5992906.1 ParB/RepB/Spo0J family partition protein [Bacillota bacterium]